MAEIGAATIARRMAAVDGHAGVVTMVRGRSSQQALSTDSCAISCTYAFLSSLSDGHCAWIAGLLRGAAGAVARCKNTGPAVWWLKDSRRHPLPALSGAVTIKASY